VRFFCPKYHWPTESIFAGGWASMATARDRHYYTTGGACIGVAGHATTGRPPVSKTTVALIT
jgi:hypothetical protein